MPAAAVQVMTDTAANWIAANPITFKNWEYIESDTGRRKLGDGITALNSLAYAVPNKGTSPVSTVNVNEYSNGKDVTAVLTLTNFVVGVIPAANAALAVGNIVYAFPASPSQHFELVYSFSGVALTLPSTGVACNTALGSVIASGAVATLAGTATFMDRLTQQSITTAAGGGTAVSALTAATAGIGLGISLNLAASVKNVFLNSAGTFAVANAGNLLANGVIVIKWTQMS